MTTSLKRHAPIIAILVLAAALRLFQIGAQSLWYDEGNSARIAERSVALIIAGAAGDIHPPLYYLLLKLWRALFGESEAALRSLSAVFGVGAVAFAYATGRDLFGRRAGLIAAALLAVAPFAVYYGQEARMYAMLAFCAAASTWALQRLPLTSPAQSPARAALIYAAATSAGLWTQYAYPFVMLAQGVWTVLWLARDRHTAPRLSAYVAANLAALLSFAPWLPTAIAQLSGWSVETQPYTFFEAALEAYRWLVLGRTLPASDAALPLLLVGGLALLGLFGTRQRIGAAGMLLLAALPLALLLALNLYRDAYLKFLLVCTAPLLTLSACGIEQLAGRIKRASASAVAATAATALTAASFVPTLRHLYFDPAYARDDYRAAQRMVAALPGGSAVVFSAPNQWEVFTYYQRDDRDLFPLRYRPQYAGEAAKQLEAIAFGRARIVALYYAEREADPEGWYERWLAENVAKVHEEWIGNIRLALYSGDNTYTTTRENMRFGDAIELTRVETGARRADGVVALRLTWRARRKLDTRYKIFVHIGTNDAPPIAQYDSEPVGGFRPTDSWAPGEDIRDERGAWMRPGTPAGEYGIFVGLYDAATGERLGERVRVGTVGDN